MIRVQVIALAALTMLLAPLAASAQITPGTDLIGTMDQSLNSGSVQPGQPFTLSNVHSANYNIHGATIYGHVASVQRAGQGTPGKIRLAFDKINTRAGNIYRLSGYPAHVDVQTKSNGVRTAEGAAAGALVGGLLGHGLGALIGAGAGGVYANNARQNVTIPSGSLVTVRVTGSRLQATQ